MSYEIKDQGRGQKGGQMDGDLMGMDDVPL